MRVKQTNHVDRFFRLDLGDYRISVKEDGFEDFITGFGKKEKRAAGMLLAPARSGFQLGTAGSF